MYCKNCGTELNEKAVICPNCGVPTDNFYNDRRNMNGYASQPQTPAQQDAPNTGFAVLGFFFPIVGLILYLVWMNTMPLRAKSCGKGALIGVIVEVAASILIVFFAFLLVFVAYGVTYI
jgi:hypothetical protein